jgi:hypothetical protein
VAIGREANPMAERGEDRRIKARNSQELSEPLILYVRISDFMLPNSDVGKICSVSNR